ncbi:hypothetical protein V5799_024037 [Amblyomma americanum]|uniref:C2H2-type domain-containing protein n=1 Tax=Amblyomma americanum TaxID=6943 RepID=A0AAQ4ED73_AMBAM
MQRFLSVMPPPNTGIPSGNTAGRPRPAREVGTNRGSSYSPLQRHSSGQPRKKDSFRCSYCGRGFVYWASFRTHEASHRAEMRFRCCFCHEVFTDHMRYGVHLRKHGDRVLPGDDSV